MRVDRHISGSTRVIVRNPEAPSWAQHYIDCRHEPRGGGFTRLECVRNGHVYRRENIMHDEPARVMQIVREEFA